ncbi:pyrimidine kinase [Citrobacter koseri]|uniref:Pyrimidine kinase n=1 Tax=Citrobacter koseri TaxID=545 RepID=A0A447UHY9_CITKO|nr:pyrimidine kinase [Citrobacter koseri]
MMNDREKQILKILRRNPLIQQNEIADILQISPLTRGGPYYGSDA